MPLQDLARILDGSKVLRKAVQATFDKAALVQRCQVHKLRKLMDHLPERQHPWVQAIMRQAYRSNVPTVRRLLQDLGAVSTTSIPAPKACARAWRKR